MNAFPISLFLLLAIVSLSNSAETPPNVILIFADDLGYGDLGCYGATKVQTPNIDRLAAEGKRFTDAHSASAVCTPSRYALLTGEYPLRANGGKGIWGPAPITSPLLVDTEKVTIADVFKNNGYDTAAFGKWHLGFKTGINDWQEPLSPGPQALGFDYYYGMPVVNSAPPYVYVENDHIVGGDPADPLVYLGRNSKGVATPITKIPPEAAQRSANQFKGAKEAHKLFNDYQVGTTFAKKSVEWIEQHKDKPFFLYFATTNIHHPFTPAKRFQGTSQCGLYGDYIHELDWIVGEILTCLEENGLSDNTMVIFNSDNGGMFNHGGQAAFKDGHRQNGDLLGFKFGVWEGGHRVPLIVRWPGKVKAGTTSNQLIGNVDMLATFAALTKQKLDKVQQADSVNMLNAIVGEPEKPIRDHLILAPHKGTHLSVRKGKWMYIPRQASGGFTGRSPGSHTFAGPPAASFVGSVNSDIENGKIKTDAPPAQLYDLEADVNQTRNLYNEHPDVVKELSTLLAGYSGKIQKPSTGPKNKKPNSGKPATKIPAGLSNQDASFDFESGKLNPWKVIEGKFGHVIGSKERFFRDLGDYNKQGKYYLTTLEPSADAEKGMDGQTGVIVSPLFIPKAGKMIFRVGGGRGLDTYVALCQADGKELQKARGINSQTMQVINWDLTPYAGKKLFLKVVDQSTLGWGHITADNFQFDAEVLDESPELKPRVETKPSETSSLPSTGKLTRSPNFVVIFADDLGYGDISCYGPTGVKTPNLDALATEGFRSTDFFVPANVCSPSRAALLTGRYPMRCGMPVARTEAPGSKYKNYGFASDEITIPELLKPAGYRSLMVGKWHMGMEVKGSHPIDAGFDEHLGIPSNYGKSRGANYNTLYRGKQVEQKNVPCEELTNRYTDEVVNFIERQKDEPFFIYVSHHIVHSPLLPSKDFVGISEKGKYGDFIKELDHSTGRIMKALQDAGLDDNTLVVFTSDNGPTRIGSTGGLNGGKYCTMEGGHRVPGIFRWPGKIPSGQVSNSTLTSMDLLPLFCELAGVKQPSDRTIDGKNILPILQGKETATPHKFLYYYNGTNLQAVREGDWKLHLPRTAKDQPFWSKKPDKTKGFITLNKQQLFDLKSDVGEKQNVADRYPEVVARLQKQAETIRAELGDVRTTGTDQRTINLVDPQER